jgi:hypothetical protein
MADKTIYLGLSSAEYQIIEKEARKAGMTLSTYCKSKIIDSEFNKYYTLLLKKVEELPLKSEFSIRQLFENGNDNTWQQISRGVKLAMGRQFFFQVDNNYLEDKTVQKKGYGPNGTMFYIKE